MEQESSSQDALISKILHGLGLLLLCMTMNPKQQSLIIRLTMMVRTVLTVAYWVFASLLVLSFAVFIFSLVLSLNYYLEYQKKEDYGISFERVENIVKERESRDAQIKASVEEEGKKVEGEKQDVADEAVQEENREERLYRTIREISEKRGLPFDVKALRQEVENRIKEQEIRIEYLEGFKKVLELAPVQKMMIYLTEYDRAFMQKYTDTKRQKQEQKNEAQTFLYMSIFFFVEMLLLSIQVALLLIERNTYYIKEHINERKQT